MRRCDALLQFLVGLAQLLFGLDQSLGLTRPLQRLGDHRRQQLHERGALDEVIVGAAFHHFHGHALAAVPGGHHEGHLPSLGLEPFDELLAAHVGQAVVEEHEAGRILLQPGQGRSAVGCAHRAMAAGRQLFLDQLQQRGVVLDNEDQLRPICAVEAGTDGFRWFAGSRHGSVLFARRHWPVRRTRSAPGRNRTCDLRFRKPLLYPLSYRR